MYLPCTSDVLEHKWRVNVCTNETLQKESISPFLKSICT